MVVAEFQEGRVVKRKGRGQQRQPARGSKRARPASPSETSSDSEYASSGGGPSDSGSSGGEVNVDLEFFDPAEVDYRGLKALLAGYLDGAEYAVHELVDTIIAQRTVGTVVKTAEDVDPIGLLTVLALARHRGLQALRQLHAFLRKRCPDRAAERRLQEAWEGDATGLLVGERLLNCPPQLGPPLVQALFQEIAWATEDEPTQELRESFAFQRYLLLTKAFRDPAGAPAADAGTEPPGEAPQGKGPKGKKGKGGAAAPPEAPPVEEEASSTGLVYLRPEDEFFHAHCSWSFTFSSPAAVARQGELQPLRLLMLLTPAQCQAAREDLDRVVGNAAA